MLASGLIPQCNDYSSIHAQHLTSPHWYEPWPAPLGVANESGLLVTLKNNVV